MPFNQKPQKFNAKINAVTIGSGDKTVTIGGENSFPFYTFDAPTENTAKIGVEISDLGLDEFSEGVKAYYEGATTMAEIAQKAAAIEGADFVALILDGGDPNDHLRTSHYLKQEKHPVCFRVSNQQWLFWKNQWMLRSEVLYAPPVPWNNKHRG